MRSRSLIADQRQGHPFRAHLPHVRATVRKRDDDSDIKLFVLSYTAFFVCFYTFIA